MRCAGSGLVHVDDELIAKHAAEDFIGGSDDRARDVGVQPSEPRVGFGRAFLDEDGRGNQIGGRMQPADRKVLDGALRLRAVVRISGNFHLAKRVAFGAERHGKFEV